MDVKVIVGTAALAAVAVGGIFVTTYLLNNSPTKRPANRWLRKRILTHFTRSKDAIIHGVYGSDGCDFSLNEVQQIYSHFHALLPSERIESGKLMRSEVTRLFVRLGVRDDKVIESLYRHWDANADGYVDFYELVEGLNVLCNGSLRERLHRYFKIYDIDGNGFIDRHELKLIYKAYNAGASEQDVDAASRDFILALDTSADQRVSFTEFMKLASRLDINLPRSEDFNNRFLAVFGVIRDASHHH